jgi:hypothetical protein
VLLASQAFLTLPRQKSPDYINSGYTPFDGE